MTTWNRDDSDLSTSTGLASTTVGNIRITGSTVGHISDTNVLTFAENTLDVRGSINIKNEAGDTTYLTLSSSGISGTLSTAAQTNITSLGTLTSLTVDNIIVNGTTIGHTSDTDLLSLASGALTVNGTITSTGNITGTLATASQPNITTVGTIGTGTWQGTAIANAYVANLPTSKTTSGTFDDARISQSSVTQHQASLSIATTQLTGNMPDARIPSTNVTQHQASITALGTLTSLNVTGAVNVGVDGTGHDVKFFGDTNGRYMLWDESDDKLILHGETHFYQNVELSSSDLKANGSATNIYMLYDTSANRLEVTNTSSSSNIYLQTISNVGANAPNLDFYKKSESSTANDVIGILDFRGRNDANDADVRYGKIEVEVIDSSKGAEEGRVKLGVTANGSLVQEGIVLKGTGSGLIDVDIANGSASTTTVAGNLTTTGDLTITGGNITNAITFDSGITDAGTISAGTWSGTALVAAKVPAHDDLTGFVSNEHIDWTGASAGTIHATNYTNTTYTGGTNLTLDGTTFNVDDAFLKNNVDDTMIGTLTIDRNSTVTSTHTSTAAILDVDGTGVLTSGQTGTYVGLDISVVSSGPTNGAYSTTKNAGIVINSTSNTSGVQGHNTGIDIELLGGDNEYTTGMLINTTDGATDLKIVSSADTGDYFSIATTTHGATTIATVDDDATAGHLTLAPDGDINLTPSSKEIKLYDPANTDDYTKITIGSHGGIIVTTVDDAGAQADIILDPDGDVFLSGASLVVPSTERIYLDGSDAGDTYITEHSADIMRAIVGGDILLQMAEYGDDGNSLNFGGAAGFALLSETFSDDSILSTGGTHDTHVDFRFGNKISLALTNDITNLNLIFPNVTGNFTLLLTYDGDHDITNWKVYEYDESAAAGDADVLWAGGTAMATTSSGIDIVSFFWDATNQKCYASGATGFAN
jgi:hypothetical protein